MRSPLREIASRVHSAMVAIGAADGDPMVVAADGRFGDYQSNCAMALAKSLRQPPRQIATRLVEALTEQGITELSEAPSIAGPGFINFRLRPQWVAEQLVALPPSGTEAGQRLGIDPVAKPQTVVVDLSSPNLAKEMHVGHLRSTVIGDAVARLLEFSGHNVIRENHVGDWGTQFGMLVAYLRRTHAEVLENPDDFAIADLEVFYVEAKALFDRDDDFRTESRDTVVALQQGDEETRRIWRVFCDESLRHCHRIYQRLDVSLIDRGESFYNDLMPAALERLEAAGLATESDGALVVYLDGYTTRDGEPLPLIVRKRDGGYNYATSDLATVLHRLEELDADRMVYVVGAPQKLHFEMLFAAIKKAGWADHRVVFEHLPFGSMLGANGKPFKTREGGTVKLHALLDQAVEKAREVIEASAGEGRPELTAEEIRATAETVGIAAIKYFDLSHNLVSDYKFDIDRMLALDGNTAPYMLYAYARIRSIGRKAGVDLDSLGSNSIVLEHESEIELAKKVLRFRDVLDQIVDDFRLNLLTDYLYDLSRSFSRFYDRRMGVRVLDAETEELRASRLQLAHITARTLALGLSLLGIDTVEQM